MTIKEAGLQWNLSEERVKELCLKGAIEGAKEEGGIWFIPDGLPAPSGNTPEEWLGKIDDLKKRIDRLEPLDREESDRLMEEFAVEYTYNSIVIEGNCLTLDETRRVLQGYVVDKPMRDHLEALGHKSAFDLVLELAKKKTPLSKEVLKEIHRQVLTVDIDQRGHFRTSYVKISGIPHNTTPPPFIEDELDKLFDWYEKSDADMLDKLAKLNMDFFLIHPFIDGNGRSSRLITNLELMKAGYLPISIDVRKRTEYVNALDPYLLTGNPMTMANIFGKYLFERTKNYLDLLQDRKK